MISTLGKVAKLVEEQKKLSQRVGLITGCFDVLHFGHIRFFRLAKSRVDYLVVGLESDTTISLVKGPNRPINPIKCRLEVLSELKSVDVVFEITGAIDYRVQRKDVHPVYRKILRSIEPDYLITSIPADDHWKEKEKHANQLQIKFLPLEIKKITSSSEIIGKLTL